MSATALPRKLWRERASAVIVPITVAMSVAMTPTVSDVLKAWSIVGSLKSCPYHSKENPVQTCVLRVELKEKKMRTAMGA